MAYFINNLGVTKEAEKVDFSDEIKENCRVVYALNKEDRWEFKALWNPNTEYEDDDIIIPVQSVYEKCIPYNPGVSFVNVIGSTGDRPYTNEEWTASSWIGMIRKAYEIHNNSAKSSDDLYYLECCTDGKIYSDCSSFSSKPEKADLGCSGNNNVELVGGHVIMESTDPAWVPYGGFVSLVPICKGHNTHRYASGRDEYCTQMGYWPGTDYYMKTKRKTGVICLARYHLKCNIEGLLCDAKKSPDM